MSSLKLYSLSPVDRSARVRWLYDEMGIEFEQVWMNPQINEHMGEPYRRVNPFGKVPGVQRDGEALFESGAIILDTLERHPESSLAPNPGDANRFEFLKWLMWGYQTLEAAVLAYLRNAEKPEEDPMRQDSVQLMERMVAPLNQHLSGKSYILGEFGAADIVVGYDLGLAKMRNYPLDAHPNVSRYIATLSERPAAKSFFEAVAQL